MKTKVERHTRSLPTTGNVSDSVKEKTIKWLIGVGVPEVVAKEHDYAQRIEVKKRGRMLLVRSTYTYRSWQGARTGETSPMRHFTVDGSIVAEAHGSRDNSSSAYEVFGKGALETPDNAECWMRDDGIRDFDRVAHLLLRWPDPDLAADSVVEINRDLVAYKAARRTRARMWMMTSMRNYVSNLF